MKVFETEFYDGPTTWKDFKIDADFEDDNDDLARRPICAGTVICVCAPDDEDLDNPVPVWEFEEDGHAYCLGFDGVGMSSDHYLIFQEGDEDDLYILWNEPADYTADAKIRQTAPSDRPCLVFRGN